jgi:hypothetical protein
MKTSRIKFIWTPRRQRLPPPSATSMGTRRRFPCFWCYSDILFIRRNKLNFDTRRFDNLLKLFRILYALRRVVPSTEVMSCIMI